MRLGDGRRRVCFFAGLLSVWLNLFLAVVLPLAQGPATGQTVASAAWGASGDSTAAPTPVCTRDGIRWIDADGQPVEPPQHAEHSLCPFCLPLTGGVTAPPPIALAAFVPKAAPARFATNVARLAAGATVNPAARPRAPPLSIVL